MGEAHSRIRGQLIRIGHEPTIAQVVEVAREERGNIQQIARRLGVSRRAIYAWRRACPQIDAAVVTARRRPTAP